MNTYIDQKPEIKLVGVSTRTTNSEEASPNGRLPQLWETYFKANIASQISNSQSHMIYVLYTDYESDATGAYTVLIGHEVDEDGELSGENLNRGVIPKSKYLVFSTMKGPVYEVVAQAWGEIWAYFQHSLEVRAYTGDFELYDARSFDPAHTEIQIYIAIQ